MKTIDFMQLVARMRREFGTAAFTVTELANLTGMPRASLQIRLSRMVRSGAIARLAHGIYGPPDVSPIDLLRRLDGSAYCTGHAALFQHGLVTQAPMVMTCFTNRRHGRRPRVRTAVAMYEFVIAAARIYAHPGDALVAPAEQALCDLVFVCLRRGVSPRSQVSFTRLAGLDRVIIDELLLRYPSTVRREVAAIMEGLPSGKLSSAQVEPSRAGFPRAHQDGSAPAQ